ncbi:MAG TPA: ROK family transcriptional regulator [Solirubrobacterales bacterium]|nr:ROK family transcriptional regulator [Solirubrobacterales bacterium]
MTADRTSVVHPFGAGTLLQLIREGDGATRADLSALTGLARSTIAQRLEQLRSQGLLRELGESDSTGGRPPMMLAFNEDAGVALAADLGATHSRLAVTNLGGTVLAEDSADMPIAGGPETVLDWVDERFHALLREVGRDDDVVRGIGIGVPGPVEHATGRPRNPPIMPGWDGYPIPERFADRYRVPVLVDNDVNIMALGEHWTNWAAVDHLLFIKVGTGIGCGIVVAGRIHRGAEGAAGDIGHIRVAAGDEAESIVCSCGNVGCLEALAGGGAMAVRLRDQGLDAADSRAVVELARAGEPAAVRLVRESGRLIGEVLAASVNLYNPSVIVIGGDVAQAHEQLLAGVREVVYQRSLPLATRHLRVVRSQLADRAGVIGAAVMVIEQVLSPAAIDAAIAAAPPGPRELAGAGN